MIRIRTRYLTKYQSQIIFLDPSLHYEVEIRYTNILGKEIIYLTSITRYNDMSLPRSEQNMFD